jgi:hypothetical protein
LYGNYHHTIPTPPNSHRQHQTQKLAVLTIALVAQAKTACEIVFVLFTKMRLIFEKPIEYGLF